MYCTDEDFAQWAFGSEWDRFMVLESNVIELMRSWNKRHGDLLILKESDLIQDSMDQMKEFYMKHKLVENKVDKKMHQVTKRMKTAVKDIKKHKPKAAVKVLKKAEKKNEKLVKIDRNVRDPLIKKAKKMMAKKGRK